MFMVWSSSTDLNGWVWEKWVQKVFEPADMENGMKPKGTPASLISLFKRGRYYRPHPGLEGGGGAGSQGRREKERFAAAAVAFLAKLDPEGVGQALREVVLEPGSLGTGGGDPEVVIQTEVGVGGRRLDLVLRFESEGLDAQVCAVEFKIDAGLGDHQNPSKSAFRTDSGYGQLLASGFRGHRIRYVVLGASDCPHPEDDEIEVDGCRIQRAWRTWADLERRLREKGGAAVELIELLSFFGIPAFQYKETNKVKIQPSSLGEAAKAQMVLVHAADQLRDQLGLRARTSEPCIGCMEDGHWHFGMDLMSAESDSSRKGDPNRANLTRIVHPRSGEAACWFGYANMPGDEPGVSVWFYCGTEKHRSKLESWLASKLSMAVGRGGTSDGSRFDLWVAKGENDPTPDREWFVEVIRSAAQMPE